MKHAIAESEKNNVLICKNSFFLFDSFVRSFYKFFSLCNWWGYVILHATNCILNCEHQLRIIYQS